MTYGKELALLDAARSVLACFSSEEHLALEELLIAVETYDNEKRDFEELISMPRPAIATILPDRMYHAHLWMAVKGGLHPAHELNKRSDTKASKLVAPSALCLMPEGSMHQMCISCASMASDLPARKLMVTVDELKELQA